MIARADEAFKALRVVFPELPERCKSLNINFDEPGGLVEIECKFTASKVNRVEEVD